MEDMSDESMPQMNSEPLDQMLLFDMAEELRDLSEDGLVKKETLLALAAELDVPLSHCLVAMVFDPSLRMEREHPTSMEVCSGRCQFFGAVAVMDRFLELKDKRVEEGKPAFDVMASRCLDQCDFGPVVRSNGPQGTYLHRYTTVEKADELATLVDD